MDGIDLGEITSPVDNHHSSDFVLEFDLDFDKVFPINNAMELNIDKVEEFYEACIESKLTRIVKSKRIVFTIKRLQEIHIDL